MTQSQALAILKTGVNVFLTGEPGSGKTHTINEYVAYLRARNIEPAITASTGIAATHIGGMTVHSWSGIGIKTKLDKRDLDAIASNKHIAQRIRRAKVLILDEVSMLSAETLSMIDAVCRTIKQNSKPFGGIQTVLVGDFFQLPPIVKTEVWGDQRNALIKDSSARFAYDSLAWERTNPVICYLTEQYRQDDKNFLGILSAIRRNVFNDDHLSQIKSRAIGRSTAPATAPKLFSHNANVDSVNTEILTQLSGEQKTFFISSYGQNALVIALKKGCLSPESLHLKVGAAVMFTKNNPKEGFVNGTLGTVEAFDAHNGYPIIKTRNGTTIAVEPMDWTVEENGKIRAHITQLPLRLAWAITVHKSQGMSLDEAVMDLSDVFEFGQGYVALSRVRRLSGLHLLGWNDRAFQVHPEVLAKDVIFRAQSEQSMNAFDKITKDKIVTKHEQFIRACGGEIIAENGSGATKQPDIHRARKEQRWKRTLELVQSGYSIADIANTRNRTEGTIIEHLEFLRAQGKLSTHDIAHITRGHEQVIAEIHGAFRELGGDKLSPVFQKLNGAHSYETLRIARLTFNEQSSTRQD